MNKILLNSKYVKKVNMVSIQKFSKKNFQLLFKANLSSRGIFSLRQLKML